MVHPNHHLYKIHQYRLHPLRQAPISWAFCARCLASSASRSSSSMCSQGLTASLTMPSACASGTNSPLPARLNDASFRARRERVPCKQVETAVQEPGESDAEVRAEGVLAAGVLGPTPGEVGHSVDEGVAEGAFESKTVVLKRCRLRWVLRVDRYYLAP